MNLESGQPPKDPKAEFTASLQAIASSFDQHVINFSWSAGQLAGSPDANDRVESMIEYANSFLSLGLDSAYQIIEQNAGISTEISDNREGKRAKVSGIITDIHLYDSQKKIFKGVAMIENSQGQQDFVQVNIRPTGETFISDEDDKVRNQQTLRIIRDMRN